jgi:hypothetical protein
MAMSRKVIMVAALAAALNAVLTPNGFAFSGGAPHVVTHPLVMNRGAESAMPINSTKHGLKEEYHRHGARLGDALVKSRPLLGQRQRWCA